MHVFKPSSFEHGSSITHPISVSAPALFSSLSSRVPFPCFLLSCRPRARPISFSRLTLSLGCPRRRTAVYGTYLALRSRTHAPFFRKHLSHLCPLVSIPSGGESTIAATALAKPSDDHRRRSRGLGTCSQGYTRADEQ
ncbi:hypothetical protein BJV74DRAFT_863935 [Russula compacta]|nr:hypothetical protein BJV74DRAFT_863935 [Russula compacta]